MGELLTISEAAKKMHVSRETIYAWIRKGKIKPIRTPSGTFRIPEELLIIEVPLSEPVSDSKGGNNG